MGSSGVRVLGKGANIRTPPTYSTYSLILCQSLLKCHYGPLSSIILHQHCRQLYFMSLSLSAAVSDRTKSANTVKKQGTKIASSQVSRKTKLQRTQYSTPENIYVINSAPCCRRKSDISQQKKKCIHHQLSLIKERIKCSLQPQSNNTDNTSTSWLTMLQIKLCRCAFISQKKGGRSEKDGCHMLISYIRTCRRQTTNGTRAHTSSVAIHAHTLHMLTKKLPSNTFMCSLLRPC